MSFSSLSDSDINIIHSPTTFSYRRIAAFALFLSFCQVNYGFSVAYSSNSQVAYNLSLILNPKYNFLYSSIINAGALIGSLLGGLVLMKHLGRKIALLTSGFLFLIGWIVFLFPVFNLQNDLFNITFLVIGRIVTGLGVGINSACIQVYLDEILNGQIKKYVAPLPTIFLCIGLLISYSIGYASLKIDFVKNNFETSTTPVSLYLPPLIGLITALLQIIFGFIIPESPSYVNRSISIKNNQKKTKDILKKLYGVDNMYDEFFGIKGSIPTADIEEMMENYIPDKYDEYFFRTMAISVAVMSLQNFYGSYAMLYNATQLFSEASGSSVLNGSLGSIAIGVVMVVFIIPSVFVSKRFGRKVSLYVSAFLQTLPLIGIGVYFYLNINILWVIVVLIILYFIVYNLSWAYLPWVLMAEIYNGPKKDILVAVVAQSNWLSNLIITAAYDPLTNLLGLAGTFWLFAIICFLTALFCVFFVPETKDKRADYIYKSFSIEHKYIFL